jgi:hypothetical protein
MVAHHIIALYFNPIDYAFKKFQPMWSYFMATIYTLIKCGYDINDMGVNLIFSIGMKLTKTRNIRCDDIYSFLTEYETNQGYINLYTEDLKGNSFCIKFYGGFDRNARFLIYHENTQYSWIIGPNNTIIPTNIKYSFDDISEMFIDNLNFCDIEEDSIDITTFIKNLEQFIKI